MFTTEALVRATRAISAPTPDHAELTVASATTLIGGALAPFLKLTWNDDFTGPDVGIMVVSVARASAAKLDEVAAALKREADGVEGDPFDDTVVAAVDDFAVGEG